MMTTIDKEVLEHLQALGFSEYEGRAYVTLLQRGPLTGYQLAKESGIPRPNIYPVLGRLQQRGAVEAIEVKDGLRYSALPSDEMLSQLSRNVEAHLNRARLGLSEIISKEPHAGEYLWNIQGYESVMTRSKAVMEGAQQQLSVGVWSQESRQLSASLSRAQARGVEPTVMCIQGCPQECGACRGRIYRYPLAFDASTRWLVVVADDREILVGQVFPGGEARAAVTRLEAFVGVGSQYLKNAIAAAEIVRSLGDRLPQLVDGQALEALQGAGLAAGDASWLDRVLSAVGKEKG
jgi:hypothetical protein